MTILINGEVFGDVVILLRRGIKQGCPASGALWTLLFDPIVRLLVATLPPHGYELTCFADDFATALGNLVLGLRLLVPVLLEMLPAAGLALHAGRTKVRSTFAAVLPTFHWPRHLLWRVVVCTWACPLVRIPWGASSTRP